MPTPGLTAGRVSGEKTLCQRYCEDSIADGPSALARQWGFRDETQLRKRCGGERIASGGFFGQNRKLQRSRKTDLGVERSRNPDLGKKNPDLGAGLAGLRCRAGAAGGAVPSRRMRMLRSDCSDSCKLRRAKARTQNIAPLSVEGVSQMVYILPERLLALVRPAFDLVLRRIRSLKRCVQACGCKIMTPRYAVWQNAQQLPLFLQGEPPQKETLAGFLAGFWLAFWLVWFGSWLAFWLVWLGSWLVWFGSWLAFGWALAIKKKSGWLSGWLSGWFGLAPGWLSGWFGLAPGWLSGWFGLAPGWLSGWFGLAPGWLSGWFGLALFFFPVFLARLAETQLLGILQAYLGVIILQPHACTQRFRLRILRRTRSNAGRTSARSLSGRI